MSDNAYAPVVHVRVDGRSEEVPFAALDLPLGADDAQIKAAVTRYLQRAEKDLQRHVVVRTSTAIIVRPEAVYG
jgi:hypothetical protein